MSTRTDKIKSMKSRHLPTNYHHLNPKWPRNSRKSGKLTLTWRNVWTISLTNDSSRWGLTSPQNQSNDTMSWKTWRIALKTISRSWTTRWRWKSCTASKVIFKSKIRWIRSLTKCSNWLMANRRWGTTRKMKSWRCSKRWSRRWEQTWRLKRLKEARMKMFYWVCSRILAQNWTNKEHNWIDWLIT